MIEYKKQNKHFGVIRKRVRAWFALRHQTKLLGGRLDNVDFQKCKNKQRYWEQRQLSNEKII